MSALFLELLNMSIAASWLILAVLLLRLLLRRAPRWIFILLWGIVAVRLVLPFSIESALSLIPSAQTVPTDIAMTHTPAIDSGIAAVDSVINPIITASFAPDPAASANPLQIWLPLAAILWAIGAAALIIYGAVSYLRLRSQVREATRLREPIYQCETIASPFVLGLFRPRIYLPYSLDAQALESVIAHEEAHIRRRDHWWKPLGFLLLTMHWFNPLLWLAYSLLCRDIELACDEKVICQLDSRQKADYARALMVCGVSRRSLTACPLAFGEVGVRDRVRSVLRYNKPAFWIILLAILVCAAAAVCFLTNPIPPADHLILSGSSVSSGSQQLTYRIHAGHQVQGGELYAEQWIQGECVSTAPVMIGPADTLRIHTAQRGTDGRFVGTELQIEAGPQSGSLTTYFPHPEGLSITGWSLTGHREGQRVPLSPDRDIILAALAFDCGGGVRTVDCELLASEPERLKDSVYMIVIRARFLAEVPTPTATASVGGADGPQQTTVTRQLTAEDVLRLSRKGPALSWADFEGYTCIETGSGLYIRLYEMEGPFHLTIGGAGPDSEPMYIYLGLTGGTSRIDIREGDAAAFLEQDHSAELLENAALTAILDREEPDRHDGLYRCASFVQLAREDGADGSVTLYGLALHMTFEPAEAALTAVGGSHVPVALTLDPAEDGYQLREYWVPRDGNQYGEDIRARFPAAVVRDALNPQKYTLSQQQACYRQAVAYCGVDADRAVGELFAAIAADGGSDPQSLLAAHPARHQQLTYYGQHTLRYIFSRFLEGEQTGTEGLLMRHLLDELAPESVLRLHTRTGQEYFDAWQEEAEKLHREKDMTWIAEHAPAMHLLLTMTEK